MKSLLIIPTLLFLITSFSIGGPKVVPHKNNKTGVNVRNEDFELVYRITKPADIKLVQDMFLRAKKIGDTTTLLKTPTHKFDFSDRWLLDLNSGQFGVLTKVISPVYQLQPKDIETLTTLIN